MHFLYLKTLNETEEFFLLKDDFSLSTKGPYIKLLREMEKFFLLKDDFSLSTKGP